MKGTRRKKGENSKQGSDAKITKAQPQVQPAKAGAASSVVSSEAFLEIKRLVRCLLRLVHRCLLMCLLSCQLRCLLRRLLTCLLRCLLSCQLRCLLKQHPRQTIADQGRTWQTKAFLYPRCYQHLRCLYFRAHDRRVATVLYLICIIITQSNVASTIKMVGG